MKIISGILYLTALCAINYALPAYAVTNTAVANTATAAINNANCKDQLTADNNACKMQYAGAMLRCAITDPFGNPDNPDSCQYKATQALLNCFNIAFDKNRACKGNRF